MDQLGPVGTAIIERLGIADDQQHLDIAAGTGEPGPSIAKLAPGGHVVLTDLAAEMLGIATRRSERARDHHFLRPAHLPRSAGEGSRQASSHCRQASGQLRSLRSGNY